MAKADRRIIELAVCLAAMMHLWLFMGARLLSGGSLAGVPVAPATRYLGTPSGGMPGEMDEIRTVWSPVLFSLPSELGFSRELLQEKLRVRLTFTHPDQTESYLDVDPAVQSAGNRIVPEELMLTKGTRVSPRPPSNPPVTAEEHTAPRRAFVTTELKERLVGGIVLPPELNQPGETAWEVRADVSITEQGMVRHVFLEKPLETASLNQAVLRLLYGLRFRPGRNPVDGRIEIYSPKAARIQGDNP